MWRNKRIQRKKRNKHKLFFIILSIGGVLALSFGGFIIYHVFFQKTVYISPLATNVLGKATQTLSDETSVIEKQLRDKQILFDTVTASGSSFLIQLHGGSEVILSSEKNINLQISSLQFILQRLTMEGRQFRRLDLRFEKPVVILKK